MSGCGGGDWLCGTRRTCEHLFHTNLRFHHLGCYQVFKLFLPEQEPVTLQEIFSYYLIVLSSNFIYKQYTHFIYLTNLYRLLNPLHNKWIICTQKLKLLAAFWFGIESRGASSEGRTRHKWHTITQNRFRITPRPMTAETKVCRRDRVHCSSRPPRHRIGGTREVVQ